MIIALVAVALVQAFLVKPFGVPSQSMEQTLHIGDRILVNRLDHDIVRGDVVVFGHGDTWQQTRSRRPRNVVTRALREVGDVTGIGPSNTAYTVKRVIGLPGTEGRLLQHRRQGDRRRHAARRAVRLRGPAVHGRHARLLELAALDPVLPRDHRAEDNLLVMGDHRSESADSVIGCRGATEGQECARFVPEDRVVGPVVLRFWPLSAFGGIAH